VDLGHPFRVVGPTIDGDILAVLAAGQVALTGREIARRAGASQEGARQALGRLVRQGVLTLELAGHAHQYRLNREHLAAKWIEGLAAVRLDLFKELRALIGGWKVAPYAARLFGSVARGDADDASDIDVLLVRPKKVRAEDARWTLQLDELRTRTTAWTGNDTRVLEYAEVEFLRLRNRETVLKAALADGIELLEVTR
jgi:predicted nucleotidyltransferase